MGVTSLVALRGCWVIVLDFQDYINLIFSQVSDNSIFFLKILDYVDSNIYGYCWEVIVYLSACNGSFLVCGRLQPVWFHFLSFFVISEICIDYNFL